MALWLGIIYLDYKEARMPFRFNIRDLMWLAAIVALVIGWRLNYAKLEELKAQLSESKINIYKLEGKLVERDGELRSQRQRMQSLWQRVEGR